LRVSLWGTGTTNARIPSTNNNNPIHDTGFIHFSSEYSIL
jgi:hypothetical protein